MHYLDTLASLSNKDQSTHPSTAISFSSYKPILQKHPLAVWTPIPIATPPHTPYALAPSGQIGVWVHSVLTSGVPLHSP